MESKNRPFMLTLMVMFILLLSYVSIIFNLGSFFMIELAIVFIFLLSAIKLSADILFRKPKWKQHAIFYMLNWLNIIFLYSITASVKEMLLPFAVSWIGFMLALSRLNRKFAYS